MTPEIVEASEALEASIAHWQRNLAAEKPSDVRLGVRNCALCDVFYSNLCKGCPVAAKTGQVWCSGSPYEGASGAHDLWEDADPDTEDDAKLAWRAAAQAELDFLISLRPGEAAE